MSTRTLGRISALWRYPVKSMAGERLDACAVTPRGLLGDRVFALVDEATGMVASAKNPRVWPDLFLYAATYIEPGPTGGTNPSVRIKMPEGQVVHSGASERLSAALGRRVALTSQPPARPVLQQFWPDDGRVTDESMPTGTFFDLAFVNVLLTTTLDRLSKAYPEGSFDIRRFRPNIAITPDPGVAADLEITSVGGTLILGDAVRLQIDSRCARCVMTTLAQPGLSKDPGILRTVARANDGFAGLNSSVLAVGEIRVGDVVRMTDA